ncbi:division plane positioning ATPase MipZ [Oceanobacter mangrovi]|uniref:division plane positioning ATPase MipZ n=1 Tax=Oceanobacter mangrovi TaxID=2862510 RepID=UPI001C8F01AA|nr:division plane positioning ATPase MipZ [Oceanobacter mangrovi]
MSMIHFVGGEKGGVGKSVMARLLSQYCLDKGMQYTGLDADQSHSTTTRYYKDFTQALQLDRFESSDAIMELALEQDQQVVVDLPAQSQKFLDRWIDDNGVLDMCEEMNVPLVYWYLVDDSPDSQLLLERFFAKYKYFLNCVVVKNEGRGSVFSDIEALTTANQQDELTRIQSITLPALHASTMFKINKNELSFWAATNSSEGGLSLMERQRTKVWMRKAYAEFDKVFGSVTSSNSDALMD